MTETAPAECAEDPGRPATSPSTPTGTSGPALVDLTRRSRGLGAVYWKVWTATAVSSVGDGLALVAFPLLAASLTTSPLLIAGVLFAQRLPWLVVGLHAGALADRLPRLRLMASVDAVRCGVVLALALASLVGGLHIALVYAAAFLLGACDTAFSGAAHAVLPEVVDEADLERANGYLMAAQTGGEQVAGPAAGGLVFAAAAGLPFLLDGLTFVISAAMLTALAARSGAPAPPRDAAPGGSRPAITAGLDGIGRDVRDGLAYFRSLPALRLLALLVGGMALAQAMVMGILVVFALDDLGMSSGGYGLLLGGAAVGNVVGCLVAARLRELLGAARLLTAAGTAAALAYLAMATTSIGWVACAALLVECVAVACGSVATVSLRQRVVPAALLGRVGNAFRVCVWGAIPVGALLGGLLAVPFGPRLTFTVAAVAQLVLVAATSRRLRERIA